MLLKDGFDSRLFLCLHFGLNSYMHYFSALPLNIPYNILMHPSK